MANTSFLNTRLLGPEDLALLRGLELQGRVVAEGWLAGAYLNPRPGFSSEFAEHREYTLGDDPRSIDWKLAARSERVYVKRYQAEINQIFQVVIDVSASMTYRSEGVVLSKQEYARILAAALAHVVIRQRDAVGLIGIPATDTLAELLPASHEAHYSLFCQKLLTYPSTAETISVADSLVTTCRKMTHAAIVVVISDCFDTIERWEKSLFEIRKRGHDVLVLQVIDPAERDFPFRGSTQFDGLEGESAIRLETDRMAPIYRDEFSRFVQEVSAVVNACGGGYSLITTDSPPIDALKQAVRQRRQRRG